MDAEQFKALIDAMNQNQQLLIERLLSKDKPEPTVSKETPVITISHIPPFESYLNFSFLGSYYMQRFENYLMMKDVFQDKDKCVQILLNSIGASNYNILAALIAPKAPNELPYDGLLQVLENQLAPKRSCLVSQYYFLSTYQKQDSSISDYVADLRRDIAECEFTVACECCRNVSVADNFSKSSIYSRVDKELDSLEAAGIISKSIASDWGSPLVVIPKGDGTVRLCVDYKAGVNDLLMNVNYPIKKIDEVLNSLGDSKYFCKLDLFKAYHHLQTDEESSIIQAISTHRGTYKMNRLSFGIKTAPSEFNRIHTRCFYYYYPLRKLLRKNQKFYWNKECQQAFLKLKEEISSDRVLVPFDPELPVTLVTDATPVGVAAVLSHIVGNVEKPVAFASRSLTEAERNYSQLDREALAIILEFPISSIIFMADTLFS
ncbi:Retrovirus-related Pol polyprotein from transposon 412 [Araneus ventricosus]|uniref:Retrovirus-related Pol polyprotein from transposon 412 n=1 Tax=Araneus ventricosus TaxID=182803 RepID=A0A4Y2LLU1_ARAVE|nr:Retrovirus-related Pol polyprotein from transposon 412 [Araneus ventricosus]